MLLRRLGSRRILSLRSMSTQKELIEQLSAQGSLLKELRAQTPVDSSAVDLAKLRLTEIKAELEKISGGSKKKQAAVKFTLKTPKGTKDWHPSDMLLRQSIFSQITEIFQLHGGVTIDTPVFELKEILSGKYGEDSKLIYDLEDQGGELCSLRYDLTVPFARFLAMYGSQYPNIKRYHIAKVYRRDQPAMTKGRMREFYQCDFDIAGSYDAMLPDVECLRIATEVFASLGLDEYTIKVNHRKILDGLFAVCGVPENQIRAISSAVDKLDKLPWEEVRDEMTKTKGLDPAVADKIGKYVQLKGGEDLIQTLEKDEILMANASALAGLEDMKKAYTYFNVFGITPKISFDLSLARGLDYYTGIIYEVVTEGSAPPGGIGSLSGAAKKAAKPKKNDDDGDESVGIGSIAAGGRYDDLVGMFSGAGGAAGRIPCVGISFGIERIFAILSQKARAQNLSSSGKLTQVYVLNVGAPVLLERMEITKMLWDAGIKTEYTYKNNPKAKSQWDYIEKQAFPLAVLVSPDEWSQDSVRVKPQVGKDEAGDSKGTLVKKSELVEYIKKELARIQGL